MGVSSKTNTFALIKVFCLLITVTKVKNFVKLNATVKSRQILSRERCFSYQKTLLCLQTENQFGFKVNWFSISTKTTPIGQWIRKKRKSTLHFVKQTLFFDMFVKNQLLEKWINSLLIRNKTKTFRSPVFWEFLFCFHWFRYSFC